MRTPFRLGEVFVLIAALGMQAAAAGTSGAQERAALEFLNAVASGSAQAVAQALHPDDLHRLRAAITARLRADAAAGDPTLRQRLFGEASNLADIERLTDVNFIAALGARLRYPGRPFSKLQGLEAVKDGERVHVVVRGEQPEGRGKTRVVTLVTLLPYGKEWKAAVPGEIEAQVEDLLDGRSPAIGMVPQRAVAPATGVSAAPGAAPPAANTPQILSMLSTATDTRVAGRCDEYYGQYMSPGFRRSTSAAALAALVKGCERSDSQRETLIAALRIVHDSTPAYDRGGNRASYDLTARGLPYDRFVLERVGERWYIAE